MFCFYRISIYFYRHLYWHYSLSVSWSSDVSHIVFFDRVGESRVLSATLLFNLIMFPYYNLANRQSLFIRDIQFIQTATCKIMKLMAIKLAAIATLWNTIDFIAMTA